MNITKRTANLVLVLTAVIWGLGYVFTKYATDAGMPAGLINAIRGFIYVVLVYVFFHNHIKKMTQANYKIGFIAGLLNFIGFQLQTIAIKYTSPSNNAFLTSVYIAMVPFIAWFLTKQAPQRKSYFSITLALLGTGILSNAFGKLTINFGDALTLISAFFYAFSIVYIGVYANKVDVFGISFMLGLCQFIFGLMWSLGFEVSEYSAIGWENGLWPVIALGIFSSFIAQTLQVVGQSGTDATTSGLILMGESLFGSLFSVLLGMDKLTQNLLVGGSIIILSQLLMQVNIRRRGKLGKF